MEFIIQPMNGPETSLLDLQSLFLCFCGQNRYQCCGNTVVGCSCPITITTS